MVKEFNEFYVYAYLRKDKTPYYVGKGSGRRVYVRAGRVVKPPKDLNRIVFLRTGLTEKKAFEWERFYIKHYGRIDLGTGILRNLTDGGEGASGAVPSEETKNKIREAQLNKKTELTNMVDGAVFIYDSLSDAARDLKLNVGVLSEVCQGKRYSTGGFLARYWSPDLKNWGEGLYHRIEEVRQKKKESCQKRGKASQSKAQKALELIQISDGKVFIFDSLRDASQDLNLDSGSLSLVCRGKQKSTRGYTARYLTLGTPSEP